jgi:two-component system, OmpR family, copper resistance phosphate regulon response regulator CusR
MNRILIAEDEPRVAAFLEKGLCKNGFVTVIAENGQRALQIAANEEINLLLLDLRMPIKNGWEVLDELRDQGVNFPVIIMTAFDDDKNRLLAMQKGASDYVTKPFQFRDLLEKVRSLISPRQAD